MLLSQDYSYSSLKPVQTSRGDALQMEGWDSEGWGYSIMADVQHHMHKVISEYSVFAVWKYFLKICIHSKISEGASDLLSAPVKNKTKAFHKTSFTGTMQWGWGDVVLILNVCLIH